MVTFDGLRNGILLFENKDPVRLMLKLIIGRDHNLYLERTINNFFPQIVC
jgi:hypothetical protein